jgi:hypothetical protein
MKCNCKIKCNPCRCGTAEGERLKADSLAENVKNISQSPATAEGERLKADSLALLEARREVFVLRGRRALLTAMLNGDGTATADDVRAAVELPPDIDPRCLGATPGRLAYDRIIQAVGFIRSTRPERHASWLQVWSLADRAASLRWLDAHPDLPDPGADDQAAGKRQTVLFNQQETATPTGEAAGAAL